VTECSRSDATMSLASGDVSITSAAPLSSAVSTWFMP
jgi:hypothetical protein